MYEISISNVVKKQLDKIDFTSAKRITTKLLELEKTPRPTGCIKLKGENGYRMRIGNYRVLYEINDKSKEIIIYKVAHRKEAYR
jgi:mRNA interferase RelE/StbE